VVRVSAARSRCHNATSVFILGALITLVLLARVQYETTGTQALEEHGRGAVAAAAVAPAPNNPPCGDYQEQLGQLAATASPDSLNGCAL
jgi:hypothetical protein